MMGLVSLYKEDIATSSLSHVRISEMVAVYKEVGSDHFLLALYLGLPRL